MQQCKDNVNEAQVIPLDMKNNMKRVAMEQSLKAQVAKLRRKGLKFVAADKNKNEAKFKFQGLSAKSQRWFDIDFDWIAVNFSTRAPYFYKKPFQSHDDTKDTNTFKIFQVPIGNEKCVESFNFHNGAPILKYCQKLLNSCCFSSLASSFVNIKQIKTENAISLRIEEFFKSEVGNRIDYENAILKDEKK